MPVRPCIRPVSPHGTTRLPLDEFDIPVFFENLSREFKFLYNLIRLTGALQEDQYTYFTQQQMHYLLTWLRILNLH